MELNNYVEALAYDTAFWMAGLTNDGLPIEEVGRASVEVSYKLRALAIAALLISADADAYCHNLARSGLVRRVFLERCRREGRTDTHHFASGRYLPFMDTVAAGAFDIANSIATLSPTEWRPGHEYEDDYCFAQICQQLASGRVNEERCNQLIEKFDAYREGKANGRLLICRGWSQKDQESFDEGFELLLTERDGVIDSAKARGQLEDPVVVTDRHVFVEGLAILRLTQMRGLATEHEYRYCPASARVPMSKPFDANIFAARLA